MKFSVLYLGFWAVLTPLASASSWSKEDREIFSVRDELAKFEGQNVTFYDFLDITPSASHEEIQKAYRKKSKSLHPDKVKQQLTAEANKLKKEAVKNKKEAVVAKPPTRAEIKAAVKAAGDRQARLSIVANVLKGPGRVRYDHFMANGFPTWKGTGYYYDRYRPGLGIVMISVFLVLGGGVHYLALYMSWKQHREFVERYIKYARTAAWGDNLGINIDTIPVEVPTPPPEQEQPAQAIPTNRRMRRMQEKETKRDSSQEGVRGRLGRKMAARTAAAAGSGSATPVPTEGPQGAKKKVRAENGKILVVDSLGDVYLEQDDEDGNTALFLLDLDEIAKPTISDTALVKLPKWLFRATIGRVFNKKTGGEDESDFEDDNNAAESDTSSGPGKHTPDSEEFELLDKDDLTAAITSKTTGSQPQSSGKNSKRKGKGKKK